MEVGRSRDWNEGKALAGIRMMERAETSVDIRERRALERASSKCFWGSIGVERTQEKARGAATEVAAPRFHAPTQRAR